MKIKEGGVMDIQKERELFLAHMRSIGSAGFMFELDEDGNFDDMSMSYAWSAWQAAKTQAVPDLSELQERIAGHQYYHDDHGHMIVDMDDVVKEIGGINEWKDQAVPEATSIGDELQSWVAVNSFAASDAVGDFPVIDANALAEVIEKLTGASQ